jgi:hypothetical protein
MSDWIKLHLFRHAAVTSSFRPDDTPVLLQMATDPHPQAIVNVSGEQFW